MPNSCESLQNPYGLRGKIGLLVPSLNFAMEFEFNQMSPPGVLVCSARLKVKGDLSTVEEICRIGEEETEKAASEVADAKVDIIVYGCTSGSFIKGLNYDKEIIRKIENLTNIPATTTSTAVIEALKELKINNLALITPYNEEVNRLEEKFLSDHGFNVVNLFGGRLKADQMLPSEAVRRARIDAPKADGIFISCTSFQTIGVIKLLENDLNKPVISSNQATMWHTLRKLKIQNPVIGYGSLLEKLL